MKCGLLLSLHIFLLLNCITAQMPDAPAEIYSDTTLPSIKSSINIPVNFEIAELQRTINKKLTGVLYEDYDMTNNDNDQLMLKVMKASDITLQIAGQQLEYKVPLSIWFKKGVLGMTDVDGTGDLTITFQTNFSINPDWSLTTNTQIIGHEWLKAPKLQTRIADVPIKYLADVVMNRSKAKLSQIIDNQIKQSLDLKKYVVDAWNKIQEPVSIVPEYKVWSKITPLSITMSPFYVMNNEWRSVFSISCLSDINIGEYPTFRKNTPLSNLVVAPGMKDDFSINLIVNVPYVEADSIAKKLMVGQTFGSEGKSVKVEDISLYGQDDNIVINTKMSGAFKGSIFLKGKPYYNTVTRNIEMKDLDFELSTKNFLFKTANWLFHKGLVERIKNGLQIPIGAKIDTAKTAIQTKLADYKISQGVSLKGIIDNVTIVDILIARQSIQPILLSTGKLNVLVKGLD